MGNKTTHAVLWCRLASVVCGAEPLSICRASVGGRASSETLLLWSSTPVGVSGEGAEEQASCAGENFFQTALPRATGKIFMAAPRKIIPFSYHRLFLLFLLSAVVVSSCVETAHTGPTASGSPGYRHGQVQISQCTQYVRATTGRLWISR